MTKEFHQRRQAARRRRVWLRFVAWRRAHVAPGVALLVLGALTGVGAGVGAWFLKWSIALASNAILHSLSPDGFNWYLLWVPFAGIIAVGCYQQYWLKRSLEHGTDQIQRDLAAHHYRLRSGLCYEPLLAAVVTLSCGGSAGAEGPIATAGAAMGSNLARLAGVSPQMVRVLVGCGAGAGIAGIFKAPVGGAMFTLEVMKMRLSTLPVLTLIVAAIFGGMTCYALTGFTFDVQYLPTSFFDPRTLGWVAALGVFCGFYSIYYTRVTDLMHRWFRGMRSPWFRYLSSASVLGLSLWLFPSLYGEGYGIVTALVNGNFDTWIRGSVFASHQWGPLALVGVACGLLLVKVWATIATNSGGGVAGDFAPTIFAGAVAGMIFAQAANLIFDTELPVGLFALLGTAGAFAGIIHAPLMAIFIVAEMVGNGYGYFLPLTVTAGCSYLIVKLFTPRSRWAAGNHDDVAALLSARPDSNKQ